MTRKPTENASSGATRQAQKGSSAMFPKGKSSTEAESKTAPESPAANAGSAHPAEADALLKEDHRKVEKLFQEYESAQDPDAKKKLCKQICMELIVHTELEEQLFYPACQSAGVEEDMLDEAQVEHDGAKVLITQLMTASADTDYYDAKVKVLSEYIKLHVGEEEESNNGIFAKARNAGVDMGALGKQLQSRKEALLAQGEDAILRPPTPRSFDIQDLINHSYQEDQTMANQQSRDDQGRFTQEGNRGGNGGGRYASGGGQQDERYGGGGGGGRSYGGRSSQGQDRDRDEYGRFASEDRNGNGGYDDRYRQDNFERSSSGRSNRDYGDYDDDNSSNRQGQGRGWYGDPEGHSQAARRGYGYDDDDRGNQGGRGQGQSGGYGDSGSQRRSYLSSGREDYGNRGDYRSSGGGGGQGGGQGRGHGGWFGDPEGHSEAARRGYQSSGRSDRGGNEEGRDDYRSSSGNRGGNGGGSQGQGQGHGGWFGDSRGHADAARRGWEHRQ